MILKDSEGQGYQYVSDKMLCINETVFLVFQSWT
ncbi:hypothetical protein D1632_05655 [Chryseobacterium nematophagum]|uniref:Uncharacterized protein n=1 Tax=Chryseobacterium nematophagum TaxID=2305228 RepID=A0A3M7LC05_9FLAO|nr:hypothetical protein D1632_05655 [Chryseobacterium nematophagum]